MKGEIKFIKKQIFGGFSREDTVSYVAKIAAERNEEREANVKAKEEIRALRNEVERLKQDVDERKATVNKLEDHIAQSIIIKVVADKDTVIANKPAKVDKASSAGSDLDFSRTHPDEIDDDIPEFEYDPNWYKQYEDEPKKKVALKVNVKKNA